MLDNFELEQFSSRSNQIHEDSKQLFLLQHSHFERILNDETRQLAGESPRCYLSFLQKLGKCCVPFSICCRCFLTYPLYQQATGEVGILSKFGRYEATVEPGLRVLNPITQKIISVSLKTQTLRIEQDVITKDNVKVKIESVIFYRVFAPVEVVYKLGSDMWHTTQCVSQIAGASLRSVAGCVQLQGLIEKREAVGESLAAEINRQVDMWGIVVDICSIKQLFVEKETGEILAAVATARRKSQAMLISARANASCAQMLKQIAGILDTKAAMQIRYLQTVEQILGNHNQSVIFLHTSPHHL